MARIIRIGLSRRGGTKAGPDHVRAVPVAGGPGNALVFSFVDDLDDRVAKIARRGIEPAKRETSTMA